MRERVGFLRQHDVKKQELHFTRLLGAISIHGIPDVYFIDHAVFLHDM